MATEDWAAAAVAAGLIGVGLLLASETNMWKIAELEQQLLDWLEARGWKPKITSTTRTEEQQAAAVAAGTSATSISWHFSGRALDVTLTNPITGKRLDTPTTAEIEAYYRPMHQKWAELGGQGLAFGPYPDGPVRRIKTTKGTVWDGGHLEFHGPYATAALAYAASRAA
jgi:hypothetical protein